MANIMETLKYAKENLEQHGLPGTFKAEDKDFMAAISVLRFEATRIMRANGTIEKYSGDDAQSYFRKKYSRENYPDKAEYPFEMLTRMAAEDLFQMIEDHFTAQD